LDQRRHDGGRVEGTVEGKQVCGRSSKGTKHSIDWVQSLFGRPFTVGLKKKRRIVGVLIILQCFIMLVFTFF